MTEAFGDQQSQAVELVLQNRIRRDRRAVQEHMDVGVAGAGRDKDFLHTFQKAKAWIFGRRRRFRRGDFAGFLVDRHDVRESAAGINRNAQTHLYIH